MKCWPVSPTRVARRFQQGLHFTLDEYGRNIALADEGIRAAELALRAAICSPNKIWHSTQLCTTPSTRTSCCAATWITW